MIARGVGVAIGFDTPTREYFSDNSDGRGDAMLSKAQHELRFRDNG